MNYRSFLSLGLVILTVNLYAAQQDKETRTYTRMAPVNRETTLELVNKYGTIQITSWKKDSVCIKAEVKAFSKDQSKTNKMFDGITINFSDSKYLIRAQTEFVSNINMLFESFKGMTSKIISYDSHVEINYYVSMPEYMNLDIENKYGDVYMENCSGKFRILISNGSFKAKSLGNNSSVKMSFCDASIKSMESGNIDASFSEIELDETNDLSLNSISSKYNIKRAGILRGESRRDKFYIESVETLRGNSYFTDYKTDFLKKEIDVTSKYGSLTADHIEKGLESININSSFSDITLNFDPGISYNVDIRQVNAFLVLPDKNAKTEKKALNEDRKEYVTYGVIGTNPGMVKVKIDATHGNIYLK